MYHLKGIQMLRIHRSYSSKIRLKSKPYELSSMEIRNLFLDYFIKEHNHKFVRSSPVIPFCDPTVPFVNAGMNQFKNIFLGKATAACKTAVNSQKCIRVGGKHNDLNLIGTDGYHHTFFEMLGNWSFGDYFKEKSCKLAWDLLTNSYKIDSTRLYVTYFGGDAKLGLKPDLECKEIWRSIGVPTDRILPFGVNENFWEMGATGPCGTCTEIHIDHLPDSNPAQRAQFVNAGSADLTELWNVVFIEYNRKSDGTLEPLKDKFIDTGMGFERLVAVLQGKSSNYDTDLFLPIFDAISNESGKSPYTGSYNRNEANGELDYAYRVIVDHARMCSVCIADGIYPQTSHRLRRIMRKTMSICEEKFEKKNLIQNAIIPTIVESLGDVYPELEKNSKNICQIFDYEQELYKSAIENNRQNFKLLKLSPTSQLTEDDVIDSSSFLSAYRDIETLLKSNNNLKTLPVEYLFDKLYMSYGLKEELIEKLAAEKNVEVDMTEFEAYKQMKKRQAKSQHKIEDGALLDKLVSGKIPQTLYHHMYDYTFDSKSRQFLVDPLKAKVAFIDEQDDLHHIVLDRTNFYHTAGGQDSDTGQLISSNSNFNVQNVEIHNGYVIHTGRFLNGTKPFELHEEVNVLIDPTHRTHLSQHHTAMHLLQAAIKKVTNRIVFQESSHISAANLKCEFGIIGKRITVDQLENVEKSVRQIIQSKSPIETEYLTAHELYALDNLTTVPGATYPDEGIRVLTVKDLDNDFESIEPCCGTHARNTSELEDFCLTSVKINNRSYDITAVAGRLVEPMKLREKNFLDNFETFKRRISSDITNVDEWEAIELEANQIKQQLSESQLPYISTARTLTELEAIDKHIRTMKRDKTRQLIESEMIDVLAKRRENNESFIVHVLESSRPLENLLFVEAEHMCHDLPVILINFSDNRIVQGRASIPLKYADKKFDANRWMRELVDSFKIKCSKGKIKNNFSLSTLDEIPKQSIDPLQLEKALQRTKEIAANVFDKRVAADENSRFILLYQLKNRISDVRSELKTVKSLDDVQRIITQIANIKHDIKGGLYPFDLKSKCSAELVEMNSQVIDAQHEIERQLCMPGIEDALSTASLNKKRYVFHVINTKYPLNFRTIMRMSDLGEDAAIILIIISNSDVTGRITIPLKYTNEKLTAKDLGDEFNVKFGGKCIHHGTRLEASVTDFQLKKELVNEQSLKDVFKRVENVLNNIL